MFYTLGAAQDLATDLNARSIETIAFNGSDHHGGSWTLSVNNGVALENLDIYLAYDEASVDEFASYGCVMRSDGYLDRGYIAFKVAEFDALPTACDILTAIQRVRAGEVNV